MGYPYLEIIKVDFSPKDICNTPLSQPDALVSASSTSEARLEKRPEASRPRELPSMTLPTPMEVAKSPLASELSNLGVRSQNITQVSITVKQDDNEDVLSAFFAWLRLIIKVTSILGRDMVTFLREVGVVALLQKLLDDTHICSAESLSCGEERSG